MKWFLLIFSCSFLIACGKDNKPSRPPQEQLPKFQDFIGRYLVHDSIVTRDPGVVYTEKVGKGKGSDQKFRADGKIEIYTSLTSPTMMNYEFKAPDTLFVWDPGTDKHHNWYSNVSTAQKAQFIIRQKIQSRVIEWHYTAE